MVLRASRSNCRVAVIWRTISRSRGQLAVLDQFTVYSAKKGEVSFSPKEARSFTGLASSSSFFFFFRFLTVKGSLVWPKHVRRTLLFLCL